MKKFIIALMVIFMSACTLGIAVTPKQKVSEFLDKYKNQNSEVLAQLDQTIDSEISNTDYKSRYRDLMTNQYKNMEYDIKNESIEGDNAVVEVEVTVYDYSSAIRNANTYLNENADEFKREDKTTASIVEDAKNATEDATQKAGDAINNVKDKMENAADRMTTDYDEDKFMDYKLSLMERVTDKIKYTIEFTLTKVNNEWKLDELSNSDIEKLHGIYMQ